MGECRTASYDNISEFHGTLLDCFLFQLVRFGFHHASSCKLTRLQSQQRSVAKVFQLTKLVQQRHKSTEISVPTATWPAEAVELYNQLNELTSDKTWVKIRRFSVEGYNLFYSLVSDDAL